LASVTLLTTTIVLTTFGGWPCAVWLRATTAPPVVTLLTTSLSWWTDIGVSVVGSTADESSRGQSHALVSLTSDERTWIVWERHTGDQVGGGDVANEENGDGGEMHCESIEELMYYRIKN